MTYVSLYRKYRPATFSEVVGQDHVVRAVKSALADDRLHHAYLFVGIRGTGKTTTARILASAVNCEQGPGPDPCGTCDQCTSIRTGSNPDVVEIDMASNGGVDEARELRDKSVFAPVAARKKVYILDEVHMASTAAFNALLKIIEEPPPHILFVMATTDPQKVLPTIMSRVQRLDLRRVPVPQLTAHLDRLGEQEGFELEPDAATEIANAGDGSVRDTMSVAEQVLSYAAVDRDGDGTVTITAEHVEAVLGITPFERTVALMDAVAARDVSAALGEIQNLVDDGHDLRRFTLDLAQHVRDLLVVRASDDQRLVRTTEARFAALQQQATKFSQDVLVTSVERLGLALAEQRQGSVRLPLEIVVSRMASPGLDGGLDAVVERLSTLELRVDSGDVAAAPAAVVPDADEATGVATDDTEDDASADAADEDEVEADETISADAVADTDEVVDEDGEETDDPFAADDDAAADTETAPAADDSSDAEEGAQEEAEAEGDDPVAALFGDDADKARRVVEANEAKESDSDTTPTEPSPSPADTPVDEPADEDPFAVEPDHDEADEADDDDDPFAVDTPAATTNGDSADLPDIWDDLLEAVGTESVRARAFLLPATPVSLTDGVLTLTYPQKNRFHATQAQGDIVIGALGQVADKVGISVAKVVATTAD